MLDLKKLDEELEKLLATETKESLSSWLEEKIKADPTAYLGEEDYEPLSSGISMSFTSTTVVDAVLWPGFIISDLRLVSKAA
jgi:hypothetical protein